jgi:hypothetical protein
MLSHEARVEREWMGLRYLHLTLEPYRQEFNNSLWPTSISDNELDAIRRAVYLATFVIENRGALLSAVQDGPKSELPSDRIDAALHDLLALRGALEGAQYRVSRSIEAINSLCGDVDRIRNVWDPPNGTTT